MEAKDVFSLDMAFFRDMLLSMLLYVGVVCPGFCGYCGFWLLIGFSFLVASAAFGSCGFFASIGLSFVLVACTT